MPSKEQRTAVAPVVIVTLRIIFVAIALILIMLQSNAYSFSLNANSSTWGKLDVANITGITTGRLYLNSADWTSGR
jgi:hypothetical protein